MTRHRFDPRSFIFGALLLVLSGRGAGSDGAAGAARAAAVEGDDPER